MAIDQKKLNDLFGDDWGSELKGDFETDDSGEMVFGNNDTISDEPAEDSNDLKEDTSDNTNAVDSDKSSEASDGASASDSGKSDDPVESRFQSLESSVDKITELLETLATGLKNQQTQQSNNDNVDEDDDIPLTKKEIKKLLQESISESLKPIQRESYEEKEQRVVTSLLQKHGKEFQDAVPAMKEILSINPDLGVQKAWDTVQKIRGSKPVEKPKATTQDSDSKTTPQKKGDAAALMQKAANLSTAKGVNGSSKDKRRAVGIDDIIKQSWDEMFA
jgi:hypothetical protein